MQSKRGITYGRYAGKRIKKETAIQNPKNDSNFYVSSDFRSGCFFVFLYYDTGQTCFAGRKKRKAGIGDAGC